MRDIMKVIAESLQLPLQSISADESQDYFGTFATFALMDNPVSSAQTRAELGWQPVGPTLFEDMREADYFKPQKETR